MNRLYTTKNVIFYIARQKAQVYDTTVTTMDNAMTFYANIVNVRVTGNDVVLEFGSFVPDGDRQFPPKGHQPDVRVVIAREVVAPLIEILQARQASAPPTDARPN
jgi:hypothetical protein